LLKDEPDMDLIDECNALLDEMEQGKYKPNPEARTKNLQKIYSEFNKSQNKIIKLRKKWSKLATAACIIIVLIGIPTTVSAFTGMSALDLIDKLGDKILSCVIGEPVEYENMTFIRNGEATKYDSIEECVKQENLDIYYTSWLPEDVYIEHVNVVTVDGKEQIIFKYSTDDITFFYKEISKDDVKYEDSADGHINVNEHDVYYIEHTDCILAEVIIENKAYYISVKNYDYLVNIIEGLKKVE